MKTYRVEISRVEYQYATIEVEANSKRAAEKKANDQADSDDFQVAEAYQTVESVEEVEIQKLT